MSKRASPRWEHLFGSLTPGGKIQLMTAVFCVFAPMAILYDLASTQGRPIWLVAVWSAYSGLVAVGWAYAASTTWRVLFFLLPVSWLLPSIWGRSFWSRADVLSARGLESLLALATLVTGYVLYMHFIGREGLRSLRHRAEIDLARRIHDTLVPDLDHRVSRYHVVGAARPATEVGGDLLDWVEEPDRVGVYVADISGHGVGAGVRMAMLKSALRTRLRAGGPLDAVLRDLNAIHLELLPPGMFTTFAGLSLFPDGRVAVALAGHHPLLHWRAADDAIARHDLSHPPLGVQPGTTFEISEIGVEAGDLLVLLTDGLTEVFDREGEEFGLERFERAVRENARRELPDLHRALTRIVDAFGAQTDDQTMVLIRAT